MLLDLLDLQPLDLRPKHFSQPSLSRLGPISACQKFHRGLPRNLARASSDRTAKPARRPRERIRGASITRVRQLGRAPYRRGESTCPAHLGRRVAREESTGHSRAANRSKPAYAGVARHVLPAAARMRCAFFRCAPADTCSRALHFCLPADFLRDRKLFAAGRRARIADKPGEGALTPTAPGFALRR